MYKTTKICINTRNLGIPRNQPEDREGLFRTRRPERGHLGHSGGWQDTEGNHTYSAIHLPIQQKPQIRGMEGYGSSSRPPPTPQRSFPMEYGQQEAQPSIPLGRTWSKQFRLLEERETRIRENNATIQAIKEQLNKTGPTLIPSGPQGVDQPNHPVASHHSGTSRSVAKSHNSSQSQVVFQEKTRIQGQKQDFFQPKAERVRPNDSEDFRIGERSTQESEIAVSTSRISSPNNRNISPTQNKNSVVTPESNLNSDALWLQISKYAEKTQKQFAELQESHLGMEKSTASMDKIVKNLQEGHYQLSKAFEETNKRLNQVFEEQDHFKRDRDCLDQDLNKLFNVYQNMKPQLQGHVLDNPYDQEDLKPDALLENKERSPSQYQDGYNMSYSEKEELKQLPEASSWPKFSGTGEYDHMKLIYYIYGLFINVPSIPDYWITARLNTAFKLHASIWNTEMKEIHGRSKWLWWKSQIIQKYSNCTWIWKRTRSLKMTSTLWTKIHMSGVLEILKDLKSFILK
ncbi:hypothetical protein O181_020479 [Austropuccinia psidii MF-1]|uniref:Uncharacterized protein n=1 Tax=Austropuccinia psidii MF-1 TaxID=1389203 RepID=A0A9Q3C906_9BASI|nr:hypothetical protein [Austropuccinia psidii MF-1]